MALPRIRPPLLAILALLAPACSDAPQAPAPAPKVVDTASGIPMILVPAGEFTMGDADGEEDEQPPHLVRLSAFLIDQHEVTQRDYQRLMGTNPSKHTGPDRPAEQVTWRDATRFCNMRSLREGLQPCYQAATLECDFAASGYRLPTEAEWERACRAGTASRYSFGDAPARLPDHGWFKANAAGTTHPVATKQPNPLGLFDLHGGVAEWCHDRYGEDYGDDDAPQTNPTGPSEGDERVLRGGSWRSSAEACRSAARGKEAPGFSDTCFQRDAIGFRCVRSAPVRPNAPTH